jgi:D-tyrosyl-tRNA(Tyr) deacylase
VKTVIQRVLSADVTIDGKVYSAIGKGVLVLIGIEEADDNNDIDWLVNKIAGLRIFNDDAGVMNLNVEETGGEVLVISQFTLQASTKKGNRPSYIKAARPETAIPLYEAFIKAIEARLHQTPKTGQFGADMKVGLINDGPVTIIIDTKNRT